MQSVRQKSGQLLLQPPPVWPKRCFFIVSLARREKRRSPAAGGDARLTEANLTGELQIALSR